MGFFESLTPSLMDKAVHIAGTLVILSGEGGKNYL